MNAAVLGISSGLMLAAVVFYWLSIRACKKAMQTLKEVRVIQGQVEQGIRTEYDALARLEEWSA